jgi:hypothetical protein
MLHIKQFLMCFVSSQILILFGLKLESVIIVCIVMEFSCRRLFSLRGTRFEGNSGLDYRDTRRKRTRIFLCYLKSVSEGNHTAVIWPRCTESSTVISWPVGISVNRCSAVVTSPEDSLSLGRNLGPKRPLSTYIDPRAGSIRIRVRESAAVTGVRRSLSTPVNSRVVGISVYSVRTSCPQGALSFHRDTCASSSRVTSNIYCSLSSHPGLPLSLK